MLSFKRIVVCVFECFVWLWMRMLSRKQQLMDSERKKDDEEIDDYVIKPPNNNRGEEGGNSATMKARDIPTLATLAKLSHKKFVDGSNEENGEDIDMGVNNNKTIKQLYEEAKVEDQSEKVVNGDHLREQRPMLNGEGDVVTLSGRTSSCDSSGVGTLTASSSSEPIEREEEMSSPPTVVQNGTATTGDEDEDDVPDGGCNGNKSVNNSPTGLNGTTQPCQAFVLVAPPKMTAGKMLREMVRGEGDHRNGSGRVKEHSGVDEDPVIHSTKATILNGIGHGIGNGVVIERNGATRLSAGNGKIPNGIPLSAAVLNQHPPLDDKGPPPSCVQEVWSYNLLEEFAKIRRIVKTYNFIAMDTEFPGIVVRPQCTPRAAGAFPYELLKVNVDRLKIIQLGVTFMDKNGKCPPGVCTWQFNFKFDLQHDLYAPDSISLLTRCGIQFDTHAKMGIEPECFGEYFMSSGMVTSDQVTYLTFHSGFDFGYLIKLLSNVPLPDNEDEFFDIMKVYFPNVYDLKFLMKCSDLHGGLQDIANQLGQERVGTQHQAGSDSLLTGMTFFKLLSTDVFKGELDEAKFSGKLYGFHSEDGKDDGWSEIASDNLLDVASPKPPHPAIRNSNGSTLLQFGIQPATHSNTSMGIPDPR